MTIRSFLQKTRLEVATNHICTLEKHHYRNIANSADQVWYAKMMTKIKLSTRISTANPRSHQFYRTNTAVRHQNEKHSQSDLAYIIHPLSSFRMYWELFMMVVFLNHLFLMPIIAAFYEFKLNRDSLVGMAFNKFIFFETSLDMCCLVDIGMTFCTGYTIDTARYVVLHPRLITSHYLFSIYFIVDVLSSIPTELVLLIEYYFQVLESTVVIKSMNLISLLKVIRVKTMLTYMDRSASIFNLNGHIVSTLKYFCIYFLLVHWCGCLQYIVPCYWHGYHKLPNMSWIKYRKISSNDDTSVIHIYTECIFRAATRLFCVASDIYTPHTNDDIIVDIIIGFIGYVVTGLSLVMFLQFLFRIYTSEIKYHSVMNQLKQYMRNKQLPMPMQKRLIDYYGYRFRGTYYRENTIFPTMSDRLRKDITAYICVSMMEQVPILKDLPPTTGRNIVSSLHQEIFLPHDIIVKAGTSSDCMYFIHHGTVAVYTPTGKEMCHLQDGAYFGEMGLISKDSKRIANVVAIETTEVFRLDRRVFNNYVKTTPDLYKKMERIADRRRRENTLVMEEIHRKHILERTMRMIDER
ncbi:Cyclic nucleotide-binding domain [Popillia japonica]|uniref:Cyclic nucleotide-binding domain n=1 Tax=Popillia japonica TaxID=7064 RepID=A0AAW1N2E2_POPJA